MDTYMECYRQYIEHFKSTFPYVAAPSFNQWAINLGINSDTSDILYASNSTNSSTSNTPLNCDEEKVESKKNYKRERGPNRKLKHLRNALLD